MGVSQALEGPDGILGYTDHALVYGVAETPKMKLLLPMTGS